jgi:antitoxin YefM
MSHFLLAKYESRAWKPTLTPARNPARYPAMTTITATKARGSIYALINEVRESHEPVQITGKQGNAVLISEEDWRSIRETLFLHSIPGMVDSIQQARAEGLSKAKGSPGW